MFKGVVMFNSGEVGRLLKVAEVAERFGISSRTVYRMIAAGELMKVKVRRSTRIPEACVAALPSRQMHGGQQQ